MEYVYQQPLDYSKQVGVVFGSFAPLHTGHLDAIYQAKKECEGGVLVVVCGYDQDKGCPLMPLSVRYDLTRRFFLQDPLVAVYAISDDELGIAGRMDRWETWFNALWQEIVTLNAAGQSVQRSQLMFYVGEESYSTDIQLHGFPTKLLHRVLNPARGTDIRNAPYEHWDEIAQSYRSLFSHNILITGTASEGKTTLTQDLGRYFNAPFSHEWAHDYIGKRSMGDWQFDCADFLTFLCGQFNHNRECLENPANRGLFISDTDVLITKMYADYYAQSGCMGITTEEYDRVIAPAADKFAKRERWDKIFVLFPHGEFTDNHLRYMEHSTMKARKEMLKILMKELHKAGHTTNVTLLAGGYMDNFNQVKSYIKGLSLPI